MNNNKDYKRLCTTDIYEFNGENHNLTEEREKQSTKMDMDKKCSKFSFAPIGYGQPLQDRDFEFFDRYDWNNCTDKMAEFMEK